ncbi:hypothetical protein CASFOL_019554 [Castilleja foliolosa]|uniref:Uncharacterized protein n=1 Tax=Castilleja foliolosa TaxID=1961234 RepID=A0ABD3D8M4_9LAMI
MKPLFSSIKCEGCSIGMSGADDEGSRRDLGSKMGSLGRDRIGGQCLKQGCGAIHGRFEEITYDIENEGLEVNSQNDTGDETANFEQSTNVNGATTPALLKNYENEIRQELEWLKSKYQMQLRGLRNRDIKSSISDSDHKDFDFSVHEQDNDDDEPKSFVSAHNS